MTAAREIRAESPDGSITWLAVPETHPLHALEQARNFVGPDWAVHLTGMVFRSVPTTASRSSRRAPASHDLRYGAEHVRR
jgi:hypothetical protein